MFFLNCSSGKPNPGLDMNRGVMMNPGSCVAPNPTQPKSKMGWSRSAFGAGRQRVGEDFLSAGCKWSDIMTTLQFPPLCCRHAPITLGPEGLSFSIEACPNSTHQRRGERPPPPGNPPGSLFSLNFHSLPLTPLRQLPQYLVVTWCSELNWVPSQKDNVEVITPLSNPHSYERDHIWKLGLSRCH